jgi:Skp family chaperone for outer membrane proteins
MNTGFLGGRTLAMLFLGLVLVVLAYAKPAVAQTTSTVGVMDMDKVYDQYKAYATARQRWEAFQKGREDSFDAMQQGLGLSPTDFAEYKGLAGGVVKQNPDRIAALKALATANLTEHDALKDKQPRTTAEDVRFKLLDGYVTDVNAQLDVLSDKLNTELQTEYDRVSAKLHALVDDGIKKTAEGKKLGIVINRTVAVSQSTETVVLWGGVDITADVIKYLNDTFKDTMLDK